VRSPNLERSRYHPGVVCNTSPASYGARRFTYRGNFDPFSAVPRQHSAGLESPTGQLSRLARPNLRRFRTPPPLSVKIRALPPGEYRFIRPICPPPFRKHVGRGAAGARRCYLSLQCPLGINPLCGESRWSLPSMPLF